MELRHYIMKFPPYWRGVFAPLSKNHQPVTEADFWMLESRENSYTCRGFSKMNSQDHNKVDWIGFVECLCEKEPTELRSQLVFLPRILLFPLNIQRNTLAFLSKHSAEIPIKCLEKLLESLRSQPLSDEWTKFHLRTMQDCVCRKQCQNYGLGYHADDMRSKLTKASHGIFSDLCRQIREVDRSSHESEGYKLQFDWLSQALSANPCTCQHRTYFAPGSQTQGQGKSSSESLPTNIEEVAKRLSASPIEDLQIVPRTSSPEVIEIIDSSPSSPMEVETVTGEKPPQKTSGEKSVDKGVSEETFGGQNPPSEVVLEEREDAKVDVRGDNRRQEKRPENNQLDSIDAVTMAELTSLKADLWSPAGDSVSSENLKVIVDRPVDQMEAVCDILELDSLPATGLVALSDQLAHFSVQLSHLSAVILARRCFVRQIQDLTQAAPRTLITAAVSLAKAFPKPTIEGALIPSLTSGGTAHQCDVISKVIKEALTNDSRVYLLSKILSIKTLQWSEELTGLLQTMLGCKLELDSNTLEKFITELEHHGSSQNSCAKFAKLLLAAINRFSKQASAPSLAALQRLVDDNRTFLKKALVAAIKRVTG